MDELARRYLKQQSEIGGAEVILSGTPGPRRARSKAAEPRVEERPARAAATEPAVSSPVPPVAPETAEPKLSAKEIATSRDWRVGAPPIPGPGITIPAKPVDLLSAKTAGWTSLEAVAESIAGCTKCVLAQGRTQTVPGEGNPKAQLVLVGEGPGQTEDETGRPFVGRAGELLNGILGAIGMARSDVFICNVVKCRPPQNRKPLPDEMTACSSYLEAQLDLVAPKVILALGATAAEALLQTRRSLSDLRGKVHSYRGIPLIVTYHPAALLRNPAWKKPTWDDVRIARQLVDR